MSNTANNAVLYDLIASAKDSAPKSGMVKRCLEAMRSHLGMDVAYVSEFVGNQSIFREVDAPGLEAMVKVGDAHSLDDVYCRHILAGRLPELMPDTSAEALAVSMPITHAVPIGKHVSVPIKMADGSVHGMFCCLGFKADPSLHERDLQMMKVFADLAAFEIGRDLDVSNAMKEKAGRIKTAIENNELSMVYQPIWSVEHERPVGFESLARFSATPYRSPDKWFIEAADAGLGTVLELSAIKQALSVLSSFPKDIYLAVNASPETILCGELEAVFEGMSGERIVLEVTEHAHVDNYDCLQKALEPLRLRGVRLAVDDAGAGYSSLQHILQLRPDLIKLDISLTRHVDLDPARRALASALIAFARETGSGIIAEGVETSSELNALRMIGIEKAQGFFLGRPMTFGDAMKLLGRDAWMSGKVA